LEANMQRWDEVHEYGLEMLTGASGEFVWTVEPLRPVGESVGLVVPLTVYTFTSAAEPELRRDAIRNARGKVNDATWMGAPAGYVLFEGASARRTTTSQGVGAWEITYRFRELDHSHNAYHGRPAGAGRWELIEDQYGNPPHASADFRTLFV
ncbi:unnamed protein product, partial [marine sediment metagenome]